MTFGFEKLDVWQKAIGFADLIYEITRSFPSEERFGLTSQMRRAAVSISSNVAEGSSRGSRRDFSRYVEIAYGSLMETISQAHIGKRCGFINTEQFDSLRDEAERIARMLSGLKSRLQDS